MRGDLRRAVSVTESCQAFFPPAILPLISVLIVRSSANGACRHIVTGSCKCHFGMESIDDSVIDHVTTFLGGCGDNMWLGVNNPSKAVCPNAAACESKFHFLEGGDVDKDR